jgi:hypothetical protein
LGQVGHPFLLKYYTLYCIVADVPGSETGAPSRSTRISCSTLHIEHAITDLGTWLGAFISFAGAREGAGVKSQRIFQPVDDDRYIYVQLDFDDAKTAEAFKGFLEAVVWASPEASPGLDGTPRARVLQEVHL